MVHRLVKPIESFVLFMDHIITLHNHGDFLHHTEAQSSAHIPTSAFRAPVALKGIPGIKTPLKGKWHAFSFQIAANFLIRCAFLTYLFQF